MAKYVYPAVFTAEKEGGYSVIFPDIDGCFTQGRDMAEAIEMATDALCLMMYDMEENECNAPAPSDIHALSLETNNTVSLICCDTLEYRKYYDNRAVKKTLTIPNWLNTMAEQNNINFSAVLQEALKRQLDVH